MEILFLTAHLPFPPASGGRRREFELVSRLGKNFKIHLCSLTTARETDGVYAKHLQHYCTSVSLFRAANPPSLNQHVRRYPWLMKRYYSEEGIHGISLLLRNQCFDLVHVEGYYLMQLLPSKLDVPVVLVEHNMEYLLNLQRFLLSKSSQDIFSNWQEYYYTFLWERTYWKQATKIVTLTTEDETTVKRLEPKIDVRMIPDGIDHNLIIDKSESCNNGSMDNIAKYSNLIVHNYPSVLFVCNFAYEPNVDAALYFSEQIFPLILKQVPNAKLFLVGNSPPSEICALATNNSTRKHIEVTGYVDSLYPFYKAVNVVVCPLRIGGGIKIKVLEAIKAGKAIVSTSIGAQGLDLNNRALCVCDKVSDFADNVIRFLVNPQVRLRQEQEALRFARTFPTWNQVKEEYVRCYNEITSSTNAQIR
jgi:glycosyltransferase involved in cell wall biosynthesis